MHSTHSVGQATSGGSENLQAAQQPLQQAQHPSQYPPMAATLRSRPLPPHSSPRSRGLLLRKSAIRT